MLDAFGVARLLTFDRHQRTREPTVEIAHEALIAHWPRLRSWVDEDRSGLVVLRHLTNSARAWDAASRDASELYRGGRLATAEEWVAHHGEDLNPLERAFLDGSVRARDDEIERARRRARRLRVLSSGLALIAVVALVAVIIAVVQQNRADRNAGRAERSRVAADVQRLLAQANATLDEDPDLPILLALEAYDRQQRTGEPPSGNLLATMQTAVQNSRILRRTDDVTGDPSALSPDGEKMALLAADDWTAAVVVDVESGAELGRIETNSAIYSLYFDPSGERLVTVQRYFPEARGEIRFHDLSSFEEVGRTSRVPFNFQWVDLSPDGRYAAAAELGVWNVGEVPRVTVVWDLSDLDGAPVQHDNVNIGGWLPDGETLVVHDEDTIGFVDPLTGEDRRPRLDVGKVYSVGVHPEREELVVLGDDLELWRLGETAPFRVLADAAFVGPTGLAAFTPDGTRIVVHGIDDTVRIIEPDSGETLVLKGNTNSAEVAMSADGARLLVGGEDGSILWDLTPAGPAASGNLPSEGRISQIALGGDSSRATVAELGLGTDGTLARVRRFDLDTGAVLASSGALDASEIVTSNAGWYAYAPPGGPARIGHLDGERVASELDRCDVPEAIDDQGRWLLVAVDDQRCDVTSTRLVDPSTGAELLELRNHHAEDAEFGPSGTIADGLLAYRAVNSLSVEDEPIGIILRRISPGDEYLGLLLELEYGLSKPQFSADGRYLSVGGEESGTYVIDVELVLADDRMSDAIVAEPRGTGGGTTSSVVGGGWVVLGQSGEVLRFYDLESGAEWMTLPIDSDGSTHFRITADERALYYESAGGVLRRLPLDHRELADLARRRAHRSLTEAECLRFEIADECGDWVKN